MDESNYPTSNSLRVAQTMEQARLLQEDAKVSPAAKPQSPTVFDEIADRVNEQVKRLYAIKQHVRAQINRLIGVEPENEKNSEEMPPPVSSLAEAFRSIDDLGGSISALESELQRINRLAGDD